MTQKELHNQRLLRKRRGCDAVAYTAHFLKESAMGLGCIGIGLFIWKLRQQTFIR